MKIPTNSESNDCPKKEKEEDVEDRQEEEDAIQEELTHATVDATRSENDRSLFVEGRLHGIAVDFLLDSGSAATLINSKVFETIPEDVRPVLQHPKIILEGVNGNRVNCHGIAEVKVQLGNEYYHTPTIVCDMQVDAILGQDFNMQHVKVIDLEKMCMKTKSNVIPLFLGGKAEMVCRVTCRTTTSIPAMSILNVPVAVSGSKHLANDMLLEASSDVVQSKQIFMAPQITTDKTNTIATLVNLSEEDVQLYSNTYLGTAQSVYQGDKVTKTVRHTTVSAPTKLPEYLVDLFERSTVHLTESQADALKLLMLKYQHIFATSSSDMGKTNKTAFTINTGLANAIRQRARRQPFGKREAEKEEIESMLKRNIIEPSNSAWASPVVLITKKDGTIRFCVDYRKLNEVTIKDAYPLPRIDECLDALSGAQWFSTMDLQSGFWQVPLATESDRHKTAFITGMGLYHFTILSFGLTNAPACFQRLMEDVLRGLQWEQCVLFMDDTIVPSTTFEEGLVRLEHVWKRFEDANLKLKPSKCLLFQKEIKFLGHVVSEAGVQTDPEKTKTIKEWPTPTNVKHVRSFLGLCSYYRKFVLGFADIARPLHKLCEKGRLFVWDTECEESFTRLKETLSTTPILGYPRLNMPFILDTDASNEAIGAVLSQEQDGSERVIAYFSKSLNKHEMNYCVSRKELLAVVQSLKKFHTYLYGQRILLRTDNAAVSYMKNLKNPSGQVARWLQELGTYDMTVEHRPGTRHRNADALSRRPCAACQRMERLEDEWRDQHKEDDDSEMLLCCVTQISGDPKPGPSTAPDSSDESDNSEQSQKQGDEHTIGKNSTSKMSPLILEGWDNASLHVSQWEDPTIGVVFQALAKSQVRPPWTQISDGVSETKALWSAWNRLVIHEGILCRRRMVDEKDRSLQVVVPQSLQPQVLKFYHDVPSAGHLCAEKVLEKIQRQFYWPKMSDTVQDYVKKCDKCAMRKMTKSSKHAPLGRYNVGEPMERVAMDILGPLPVTKKGNKYVLVVTDLFTKWTEAYPLPDQEAKTIAVTFVNEFVCRFGVPIQIITDQGSNFESHLFKEMCDFLQIDKTRTSAYRPQANGSVERFNRTLATMLAIFCQQKQNSWDVFLPQVMLAYRASPHSTTGKSPNLLTLGREVILPMQAVISRPEEEEDSDPLSGDDYLHQLRNSLNEAHNLARKSLKKQTTYQQRHYDLHATKRSFQPGQLVWIHNPIRKTGVCQKLSMQWRGPYLITKKIDDLSYLVKKTAKGVPKTHHIDRLRLYRGSQVPKWTNGIS